MMVGALSSIAPHRRNDLCAEVFRALVTGTIACWANACWASALLDDALDESATAAAPPPPSGTPGGGSAAAASDTALSPLAMVALLVLLGAMATLMAGTTYLRDRELQRKARDEAAGGVGADGVRVSVGAPMA